RPTGGNQLCTSLAEYRCIASAEAVHQRAVPLARFLIDVVDDALRKAHVISVTGLFADAGQGNNVDDFNDRLSHFFEPLD
ncbi:hypothetical protein, partial [Herbaspirillum sp. B65]|uniref:hypothetical protein n=1 Tax=Herbaspirillum sp. B65 TaxID=137708 RepID=UPI001C25AE61